MPRSPKLPTPASDALAHSEQVLQHIRADIEASGGWISFDRYFELCQYAPALGYYSAGATKFGRAGDFVTAPELGRVFARCVAHSWLPTLAALSAPDILEVGCGSGAFAADALQFLAEHNALPNRYLLLERSADLRARQKQRLSSLPEAIFRRVHWLDQPPTQAWQGLIFGNEVIDALPCKRFEISANGAYELGVRCDGTTLDYALGAQLPELDARLAQAIAELPQGYRSEFQPQLGAWQAGLSQALVRGLVMWIDYGYTRREYYLPERGEGTLVCHYQQHMFDAPFLWPGLVDLSASVEFTAVAEAGSEAGLELAAFMSQGEFLLDPLARAPELILGDLYAMTETERLAHTRQIRLLTLPGEMGERMQMIAFARDLPESARAPILQHLGRRDRL